MDASNSNPAGAALIVPGVEQDHPLVPADLPIRGKLVFVDAIAYSRLAAAYLKTMVGKPTAGNFLLDLATLFRMAGKTLMEFCVTPRPLSKPPYHSKITSKTIISLHVVMTVL